MTAPTITASPLAGARFSTTAIVFGSLAIALLVMIVVSAGSGQLDIPAREVIGSICHRLGLDIGAAPAHPQGEAALWHVRFPRIVMGIIVGASLATAGTLMQGVFGNPLAEPGVVGVSAGAAVAAASAIAFGITVFGNWTIPLLSVGRRTVVQSQDRDRRQWRPQVGSPGRRPANHWRRPRGRRRAVGRW